MANLPEKTTPKSSVDLIDIRGAYEWLLRYYPSLWDRVSDKDLIALLSVTHTLFKTNPEILEAPLNKSPTQ